MGSFTEDSGFPDVRSDNVFKAVFTRDTPESRGALSHLISALIGRDLAVIAVTANEPPPESTLDRQIRFDINCKASTGEPVNVEMSFNPGDFEPLRIEFFACKLFTGQNIRGKAADYGDLEESWQITVIGKRRFFPDEEFYHQFRYYDRIRGVSLGGRSRIVTLELAKAKRVADKPVAGMSPAEKWAVFFEYLPNQQMRSKIEEIAESEEGIKMAEKVLNTFTKSELAYFRQMSKLKYELDRQSMLVEAQRKGIQEGRQKGIQEVIGLLKSGKPPEEIIREYGAG
jgi:predicted transposase/invertase (TIGR01784 family)